MSLKFDFIEKYNGSNRIIKESKDTRNQSDFKRKSLNDLKQKNDRIKILMEEKQTQIDVIKSFLNDIS